MILGADPDIWRWQAHPEVWLIVVGAVLMAGYVARVIGPKAVPEGERPVTGRQIALFTLGMALLWASSDWPLHDVSEEYLYSAHMIQHMIITLLVPPLLLMATPEWLGRLLVSSDGEPGVWVRRLTRPVVAGLVFNAWTALTHLPSVVNTSIDNGGIHYLVHLVSFVTAVMMWMPVVGPIPELRMRDTGRMVYLFLMSVLPTVPAGFLTFAEGTLYRAYDHDVRLWGISVATDQQAAGLIMKIAGGMYLWAIIGVLFFRWADQQAKSDAQVNRVRSPRRVLTYEEVESEFEQAGPAPVETVPDPDSS